MSQQNHEMAWRQRDNNACMNYMQNGQSGQNNFHPHNHNTNNQSFNNRSFQPLQPPPPPKRADKRRFRHDLPGPAGAWFQLQKQKNRRKSNHSDRIKEEQVVKLEDPEDISSPTTTNSNNESEKKSAQLFKDYSSKLHDCNAWNLMCLTHERIVPTFHTFNNFIDNDEKDSSNASNSYKTLLRTIIPQHQSLIHEIHNGQHDTHHLSPSVHMNNLRIPLLFGYVSTISCHAHSDWTATLVDESYSCGGGGGRGITCWLEEKLVKRHPGWIRPGVVWMLEGSKLALFASKEDGDDEDPSENCEVVNNDVSPSTEAARNGYAIDRVILVGEESLIYAWTPEEASEFITDDRFKDLLERRCNVDMESGEEMKVNGKNDVHPVQHVSPTAKKIRPNNDKTTVSSHDHSIVIGSSEKSFDTNDAARQKISPVVSRTDTDNIDHLEQTEMVDTERNDAVRDKNLDHNEGKRRHNAATNSFEYHKEVTVMDSRQHVSDLQNASKCNTKNLSLIGSAVEHDAQAESQEYDSANDVSNRNTVVPNASTTSNESTQSTMAVEASGAQVLSDKISLTYKYPSSATLQPNPYLKKSTKKASRVSCNTTPVTNDVLDGRATSTGNPCPNIVDENSSRKIATPKSLRSTHVERQPPPTVDSIDTSLDIDEDQMLCTSNNVTAFAKEQNTASSESIQSRVAQEKLDFTPPTLPPLGRCNANTSCQKSSDVITPKRSDAGNTTRSIPIQCPPTGDSFDDSLDINDEELFCTSNKPKTVVNGSPPVALSIPVQNVEISRQETDHAKLLWQNPTAATNDTNAVKNNMRLTSGPNYDDVDLDSLGDEDDL